MRMKDQWDGDLVVKWKEKKKDERSLKKARGERMKDLETEAD